MQTIIYRMDKQQYLTVYTVNYIQYPLINHNRKEWERIYIYITESLCCIAKIKHNIINQLYFNKIITTKNTKWTPSPKMAATRKGEKKWTGTEYLQRSRHHAGTFTQVTSFNSHEDPLGKNHKPLFPVWSKQLPQVYIAGKLGLGLQNPNSVLFVVHHHFTSPSDA